MRRFFCITQYAEMETFGEGSGMQYLIMIAVLCIQTGVYCAEPKKEEIKHLALKRELVRKIISRDRDIWRALGYMSESDLASGVEGRAWLTLICEAVYSSEGNSNIPLNGGVIIVKDHVPLRELFVLLDETGSIHNTINEHMIRKAGDEFFFQD